MFVSTGQQSIKDRYDYYLNYYLILFYLVQKYYKERISTISTLKYKNNHLINLYLKKIKTENNMYFIKNIYISKHLIAGSKYYIQFLIINLIEFNYE